MKAKYYYLKQKPEKVDKYIDRILNKDLNSILDSNENEVLYGRAGYLSSLAYLRCTIVYES